MGNPVVHFEIIGAEAAELRRYFADLFGWQFDTSGPVAPTVSEAGNYGFVTNDEGGIPGGVGGGAGYAAGALFYVGVADVEAALRRAEELGGTRLMGPAANPGTKLVVGHLADPEGNVIGVASGV